MCGIFGVVSARQPIDISAVRFGLECQSHRGPDGEGVWLREEESAPWIAFGHRRLAIIDLSQAAAQPMMSADRQTVVTFNGEIYNYRELIEELSGLGWRFHSQSDTEALLVAYRQWGVECLARLNGMFAFAIWDERTRELFAARDRFGEKPFHYISDSGCGRFAFTSEMKGLFAALIANVELNDAALIRYSQCGVLDGDAETIYCGIRRLLPGRALKVTMHDGIINVKEWTYWSGIGGVGWDSVLDPVQQFRDLFQDSIRLRLRADVPVGTSLSGGLDSASVICMIQRIGAAGGQKAFSARMTDPRLDEGKYIHAVLNKTGIRGFEVVPTHHELEQQFCKMCFHQEEPFPATSMFAQFLVMRLAREHGVTVLLDGQGADELLGGYDNYFRLRYSDLIRSGRWRIASRELREYQGLRDGQRALAIRGVLAAFLPARMHQNLLRTAGAHGFASWWDLDWRQSADRGATRAWLEPYFDRFAHRLRQDALKGPLQELLRFGDRNSMAWSRELRQPFLDHRLAEFALSLPAEWKISGGMTKVVLRQAMNGIIPAEITNRTDKLGYQAPLGQWLSEELSSWVESRLIAAEDALGGRAAPGLVERFRSIVRPVNEWREGRDLFRMMTLGEGILQMKGIARAAKESRRLSSGAAPVGS